MIILVPQAVYIASFIQIDIVRYLLYSKIITYAFIYSFLAFWLIAIIKS